MAETSRELKLILRLLRDKKSNTEIKKLEEQITEIHKKLAKTPSFGSKLRGDVDKTSTSINKLRGVIDKTAISLGGLGQAAGKIDLRGLAERAATSLGKLIEHTRRAKGEMGRWAKEAPEEISKISAALDPATNAMLEMANVATRVERHSTSLAGHVNNLRTEFYSLRAPVAEASGLLDIFGKNILEAESPIPLFVKELTRLEIKLRDVQALGQLKRIFSFEQDIQTIKIFQQEVENLRLRLAQLSQQGFSPKTVGVTQDMIVAFKKAESEVRKLATAFETLPDQIQQLKKLELGINQIKSSTEFASEKLKALAVRFQEAGTVGVPELDKLINKYLQLRTEVTSSLKNIGVAYADLIYYPSTFAQAHQKATEQIQGQTSKTEATINQLRTTYDTSMKQMIQNTLALSQTSVDTFHKQQQDLTAQVELTGKLRGSLESLLGQYRQLRAGLQLFGKEWKTTAMAGELQESVLKKIMALQGQLPAQYQRLSSSIQAWITQQFRAVSDTELLDKTVKQLEIDLSMLAQREQVLISANEYLANSETILSKRVDLARESTKRYADTIILLTEMLQRMKSVSGASEAEMQRIRKSLEQLSYQATGAGANLQNLSNNLDQVRRRGADTARALERVTARGFANMIVSQAAWMAGFQVIFGTLDKFKKALGATVETQEAVVRAMRTARSETKSYIDVYRLYAQAITEARAETGAAIADLGEILYQLGSAGLSAEESLAALTSTLANIIGTEAEVRDITKLVAGLYNNFKDQIVKVDGRLRALSATTRLYADTLIETASLQDKFRYINDLLVAGFRDNQVEMMELRDGLKFMAQSARAANLALDEQVGILAYLNNHLIKAGMAGRAMRVILSKLSTDATGFAEAFNINIDLSKPLNFFEIMGKLNERYKGQTLAIEELGKVFKKLGLRGAEAFNLLMKNIDEVESTIGQLRDSADGAAEEMQKIRLSDLASQAAIAAAEVETLLKTALNPLAQTLGIVVGLVNTLYKALAFIDKSLGGVIGSIITMIGRLVAVGLLFAVFTNFGRILNWIVAVFINIGAAMGQFGALATTATSATARLTSSLWTLKGATIMYSRSVTSAAQGMAVAGTAAAPMLIQLKGISKWVNVAKVAFMGLSMILRGGLVFLGIEVLIKSIQYFATATERAKKAAEEQKKIYQEQSAYVNKLETLVACLGTYNKITEENRAILYELALQTGITIKADESHIVVIEKVVNATKILIKARQALADEMARVMFEKEGAVIDKLTDQVEKYGRTGVSVWGKLAFQIRETYWPLAKLYDWIFKLSNSKKKVVELASSLADVEKAVRGHNIQEERQKKLGMEDAWKKRKEALDKQRESILLASKAHLEYIRTHRDGKPVLGETAEAIKRLDKDLRVVTSSTVDTIKEFKKLNQEILNFREAVRMYEGYEKSLSFVIDSSALVNFAETLEEFRRKASLESMIDQTKMLITEFQALNEEGLNLEAFQKVVADANKQFGTLQKEIDGVVKKVISLRDENIKLGESVFTIRTEALQRQFDLLASKIESNVDEFEKLMSATDKYDTSVRGVRDTISQTKMKVSELSVEVNRVSRGTEEWKKASSDLRAEEEILLVYTERLNRAEAQRTAQVGSGIRNLETMRSRTEELVREIEELTITKIRADAELNRTNRGTEEWRSALANVRQIQESIYIKQEQLTEHQKEEVQNQERVAAFVREMTTLYGNQIDSLKGRDRLLNQAVAWNEGLVRSLRASAGYNAESQESIRKESELMEKTKAKLTEKIGILDQIKKSQQSLIDLEEKTGKITELEASRRRALAEVEYGREAGKIKNILDAVGEKQIEIAQQIQRANEEMISNLVQSLDQLKASMQSIIDFFSRTELKVTLSTTQMEYFKNWYEQFFGRDRIHLFRFKYVAVNAPPKEEAMYRGGALGRASGGLIPARVTAGEGYVPPSKAMGNLNLLNSLNGGRSVPGLPFGVAKFAGRGGVDAIHTLLPKGSYIISKKGMQAFEQSMPFAEGGEVNEDFIKEESSEREEKIGSFTIIVQKDGVTKEFPVQGRISVLRKLQDELEEERMTKLH